MSTDVDPMVALVESWDTYLVHTAKPSSNNTHTCASSHAATHHGYADADARTSRSFLSDARPPLSLFAAEEKGDGAASSCDDVVTDTVPSLLWLLTLVSRNVELLRAAAHLFLQFNAQFAALLDKNEDAVNTLRERHQQQLASLLEVADSHTTSDMIVDSTVTERVVHQQEDELDTLERECAAAERRLELQLQQTLFTFLNTSAPDAVAAANRKDDTLNWVPSTTSNSNGGGNGGAGDGLYRAEVDVSRFAEVRKPPPRNVHQHRSAVSPFSPLRLVPVRTIRLNNEAGNAATTPSASRRRSNDVTLQPIILDVSPLSGLSRCLTCCSGTQPGAVSSSVSSAAEEHLLRLAHTRHSVLLLIGTETAAMDVVAACRAPELLLGAAHSCRDGFTALPNHPLLRVLFTTRLWGANVVLLWNPSQGNAGGIPASSEAARAVVEDAMELAYAWDADMFSVAVLEGARLPHQTRSESNASPSAAFLAGQSISMEVLRQLRNGVTRELLETAGARRSRRWQGSTRWLQLGGSVATTAGTHMCPRAVGVLYASQAAAAAAAPMAGEASSPLLNTSISSLSSSAVSSPVTTATTAASSPSAAAAAFRGPPVTFNTPLAIRAFLPLPEEYFIKERPNRAAASAAAAAGGGGGSGGLRGGGRGGQGGTDSTAYHQSARGRVGSRTNTDGGGGGSGFDGATTLMSELEDSAADDADFSHGSFTSSSAPRSTRGGFGGGGGGSAGAGGSGGAYDAAGGREGRRDAMGLEALIQYAFGEFAEAL